MWWRESRPQFFGVKEEAANIGQTAGNYTTDMFKTDFPQFFDSEGGPLAPATVMDMYMGMANVSIPPDKWLDKWRYAAGLYVAHYITLYLRTYAPSSENASQAAKTGALVGVVKSAALGDSSVTYDTSSITAATSDWGSLNATQYGQMLATEARLIGLGGTYVI